MTRRPTTRQPWLGDAKLAGRVRELPPNAEDQPPGPRFGIDISEVVLTRLNDAADLLVIESWHPGRGLETQSRT